MTNEHNQILLPALNLSTDYENYYNQYYQVYDSPEKTNDLTRQIENKLNEIKDFRMLSPTDSEENNKRKINRSFFRKLNFHLYNIFS